MSPPLRSRMPCGCTVDLDHRIEFCGFHAAADEMFRTLVGLSDDLGALRTKLDESLKAMLRVPEGDHVATPPQP